MYIIILWRYYCCIGGDGMKVYSPNDMAMILQIKPATLRKYSSLLEQYGYQIERNSQNHRYYRDKDIVTIRNVIRGTGGDVTLEQSVQNVIKLASSSELTNDTNSGNKENDSDIKELKQMVQVLTDKVDQQQEYINSHLKERDQLLMQSINELMERKKQIATTEEKKGFFARLFDN